MLADGKQRDRSSEDNCNILHFDFAERVAAMAEWEDLRREARRLEASLEVSAQFSDFNSASLQDLIPGQFLAAQRSCMLLRPLYIHDIHIKHLTPLAASCPCIAGQSASVLETCTASEQ